MFSNLGVNVSYTKEKGVVLEGKKNAGAFSVLDFKDADRKTLQLLKIAVFSEAFSTNTMETLLQNE